MAQASREGLAAGDLQQASERGWGAAVQMFKAIGNERGREHSRHRHYLQAISRLCSETGYAEVRNFSHSASALDQNSHDSFMSPEEVSEGLDDIQALLGKVSALLPQQY